MKAPKAARCRRTKQGTSENDARSYGAQHKRQKLFAAGF